MNWEYSCGAVVFTRENGQILFAIVQEQSGAYSFPKGQKCGYDGVNLLNASGESAGQSVSHFHIHIIPRRQNDQIDAWPEFEGAKEDITDVFSRIRMP
ncbi:MAG: HIT domain-containing protein [Clostridia bacterium]|nr:HIT domain-containing protein [Clostridia bacterium]